MGKRGSLGEKTVLDCKYPPLNRKRCRDKGGLTKGGCLRYESVGHRPTVGRDRWNPSAMRMSWMR